MEQQKLNFKIVPCMLQRTNDDQNVLWCQHTTAAGRNVSPIGVNYNNCNHASLSCNMYIRFLILVVTLQRLCRQLSTGKIRSFYLTLRIKTKKKTSQFDMVSITVHSMFIHFSFFPRNLSQAEFNSWINIQCFTFASTTQAQTSEGKHVRRLMFLRPVACVLQSHTQIWETKARLGKEQASK